MNLIILSDTHGLLRPAVLELLQDADAILHAGDINSQAVVDKLASFAPLYVVRGNNDKEWAESLPRDLTVTLEGIRFYMVHNKKDIPADLSGRMWWCSAIPTSTAKNGAGVCCGSIPAAAVRAGFTRRSP